jgi:hypothetical protein
MISYIIAVTLHARRNNVMPVCSYSYHFFMDDITLVMNIYWIDFLFTATLELKLFVSSRV